jgi:hypothetical protein
VVLLKVQNETPREVERRSTDWNPRGAITKRH